LLLGTVFHEKILDGVISEEPYAEVVEKHFSVEEFLCPACGLHLFGTDEIAAAELTEVFTEREEREREFEEEYMNE